MSPGQQKGMWRHTFTYSWRPSFFLLFIYSFCLAIITSVRTHLDIVSHCSVTGLFLQAYGPLTKNAVIPTHTHTQAHSEDTRRGAVLDCYEATAYDLTQMASPSATMPTHLSHWVSVCVHALQCKCLVAYVHGHTSECVDGSLSASVKKLSHTSPTPIVGSLCEESPSASNFCTQAHAI